MNTNYRNRGPRQAQGSPQVRVGISHGDFNGISYEVIIKTFADKRILDLFTPIIYGSSKVASYYRKNLGFEDVIFNLVKKADYANPKRANIINCFQEEVKIDTGKITSVAGEMAYRALERVIEDLKWNMLSSVLRPI